MSTRPWWRLPPALAAAAVLALALGGAGCKKEDHPTPAAAPPVAHAGPGGGAPPQGQMLMGQKGCMRCHSLAAQGAPAGKGKGPDLSKEGADPTHTPEWIMEYVRDPQSKKPDSKMPKQDESRVSDQDLKTIAEYLSGLK